MVGSIESLNALQAQLAADRSPRKVNLMYGVYRPDDGQPLVLPSVKKVRTQISSWWKKSF